MRLGTRRRMRLGDAKMRYFDRLHPLSALVYFLMIILIAMITMHPVITAVCYLTAVIFCGMLIGFGKLLSSLAYSIPLMILTALTNPIFVHKGETILFFLNDNPVTAEAILYGANASMMLMAVFYWCRNYSTIMTSDKFIYLFGRVIPKLSLVLSLTLAFIPKLKRRYKEIDEAQKGLGIYAGKSFTDRILGKFRVLSILLTDSLENALETADSMKARGYGLKGRASYAIYRFTLSDLAFLIATAVLGVGTLTFIALGAADFGFYPSITPINLSIQSCVMYCALAILGFVSVFCEIKENLLWRYWKSKT